MQYLIHTGGDVVARQARVYAVTADTKAEAQELAKQQFAEEYSLVDNITYTKVYPRTRRAIAAFILMFVPILLSLVSWSNETGHELITMRPEATSIIYAAMIYIAFVIRFKGIQRTISSWIDIAACLIVIVLISSFIQAILTESTVRIFWMEFSFDPKILLIVAIILSWLGLKFVSVICMAVIAIYALFAVTTLSHAMGSLWGTVYVLCSLLGMLFYFSIEPVLIESLPHFKKAITYGLNHIKEDTAAVESVIKRNIENKRNGE